MRRLSILLTLTLLATGCHQQAGSVPLPPQQLSLREARQRFETRLIARMTAPQNYPEQAPQGVEVLHYESDGKRLVAWLARPLGPGPFPAVLYLHGGFALEAEDLDTVQPFLDAGFVVLLPALRGENGNPGLFELCYGEVNDAEAALAHLATLPGVDAKRLFVFGHSTNGGTIAMLLAEISDLPRGAVAASPMPDMRGIVDASGLQPIQNVPHPFDWRDPVETDLRSPGRHLAHLRCPLAVYVGDREDYPIINQARGLASDAKNAGKTVTVEAFEGADHTRCRDLAVHKAIERFRAWAK